MSIEKKNINRHCAREELNKIEGGANYERAENVQTV